MRRDQRRGIVKAIADHQDLAPRRRQRPDMRDLVEPASTPRDARTPSDAASAAHRLGRSPDTISTRRPLAAGRRRPRAPGAQFVLEVEAAQQPPVSRQHDPCRPARPPAAPSRPTEAIDAAPMRASRPSAGMFADIAQRRRRRRAARGGERLRIGMARMRRDGGSDRQASGPMPPR